MRRFRRFTISRLLLFVTLVALTLALWITPVKFTFELRGTDVRTSANVGDIMDVRDHSDWSNVLIHKAEITDYVREGNALLGTDVDIVTVKTTLYYKIRASLHDNISAMYYEQ